MFDVPRHLSYATERVSIADWGLRGVSFNTRRPAYRNLATPLQVCRACTAKGTTEIKGHKFDPTDGVKDAYGRPRALT